MIFPECRRNTLEPVYMEVMDSTLNDIPYSRANPPRNRRRLISFRCTACHAGYYAFGGETPEETYWRIVSDYAKD